LRNRLGCCGGAFPLAITTPTPDLVTTPNALVMKPGKHPNTTFLKKTVRWYSVFCRVSRVKFTLEQATKAHRESRSIALPFLDHGTRRGEGSESRPGRSLLPGKNQYPLYKRLGGPQGQSEHVRKISPHRYSIPRPSSPTKCLGYGPKSEEL
jgi:hypothetical protein